MTDAFPHHLLSWLYSTERLRFRGWVSVADILRIQPVFLLFVAGDRHMRAVPDLAKGIDRLDQYPAQGETHEERRMDIARFYLDCAIAFERVLYFDAPLLPSGLISKEMLETAHLFGLAGVSKQADLLKALVTIQIMPGGGIGPPLGILDL